MTEEVFVKLFALILYPIITVLGYFALVDWIKQGVRMLLNKHPEEKDSEA